MQDEPRNGSFATPVPRDASIKLVVPISKYLRVGDVLVAQDSGICWRGWSEGWGHDKWLEIGPGGGTLCVRTLGA
jgi:hypothetical protein